MYTYEMRKVIDEAKTTLRGADNIADDMAFILIGRLRKVRHWNLKKLKKELSNFNAHTGKWKS